MKWLCHEREVRVIYSLTTDRQPDSNTQEMTKKQLYPSDFSSFPPLHEEILPTTLTVIQAFTCIS